MTDLERLSPGTSASNEVTEHAQLVADAFGKFFRAEVPTQRVRAATHGYDRDLWKAFAQLGGHRASLPEADGGAGGSFQDAVLVGIEAGRRLAPIPYADCIAALRLASRLGIDVDELTGLNDTVCVVASLNGQSAGSTLFAAFGAAADAVLIIGEGQVDLVDVNHIPDGHRELGNLGHLPMAAWNLPDLEPLRRVPIDRQRVAEWRHDFRLLCAAVSLGAGRQALELAVDYVKNRVQFDRVIGAFQAVQHRLADCAAGLEGAERLLIRAAACQAGDTDRPYLSAAALHAVNDAAEGAAKETMQLHGGYGVCFEYEPHLYLRFTKAAALASCDTDLTDDLLRPVGGQQGVIDGDPPADSAKTIDQQVAALLEANCSPARLSQIWAGGTMHDPQLHRAIAAEGWIGARWPAAVGGRAMAPKDFAALWEAFNFHMLPVDILEITEIAASAILRHGTDEQRRGVLPGVIAGETIISLGYTEPDSGSDVASARTAATTTPEGWLINGAKMFTTGAHITDYILVLARTDPAAAKHRGLSLFLVPTSASGIAIEPVDTFGGERTNAVFLDDVAVPDSALVGGLHNGWTVLTDTLDVERSMMGGFVGQARRLLADLHDALGELGRADDPNTRRQLAAIKVRVEAASSVMHELYERMADGRAVHDYAAMTKLIITEAVRDASYLALDLAGPRALIEAGQPGMIANGSLEHWFRHAQVLTIYGGSSEIQRNIIAQHHLGLPKP